MKKNRTIAPNARISGIKNDSEITFFLWLIVKNIWASRIGNARKTGEYFVAMPSPAAAPARR